MDFVFDNKRHKETELDLFIHGENDLTIQVWPIGTIICTDLKSPIVRMWLGTQIYFSIGDTSPEQSPIGNIFFFLILLNLAINETLLKRKLTFWNSYYIVVKYDEIFLNIYSSVFDNIKYIHYFCVILQLFYEFMFHLWKNIFLCI